MKKFIYRLNHCCLQRNIPVQTLSITFVWFVTYWVLTDSLEIYYTRKLLTLKNLIEICKIRFYQNKLIKTSKTKRISMTFDL